MLESVPRFIIQDAQCTDVDTAWGRDWNAGVEARFRPLLHIRPIAESGILGEVVDDVRERSGVAVLLRDSIKQA